MATPWLTGQGSQAQEVPPKEFTSSEIFPETSNEIACEQCGLERPARLLRAWLEEENARLKRLLAEAELDKAILREAARPNF